MTIPGRRQESSLKTVGPGSDGKQILVPKPAAVTSAPVIAGQPKVEEKKQEKMAPAQIQQSNLSKVMIPSQPKFPRPMAPESVMKIPPPQPSQPRRPRMPISQPQYTPTSDLETIDVVRRPKLTTRQFSQDKLAETTVSQENLSTPILKPEVISPKKSDITPPQKPEIISPQKTEIPLTTKKSAMNIPSKELEEVHQKLPKTDLKKAEPIVAAQPPPKSTTPPSIEVIPSTPAPPDSPPLVRKSPQSSEKKPEIQPPTVKAELASKPKTDTEKDSVDTKEEKKDDSKPSSEVKQVKAPAPLQKQDSKSDSLESKPVKKQAPPAPAVQVQEVEHPPLPTSEDTPRPPSSVSVQSDFRSGWI